MPKESEVRDEDSGRITHIRVTSDDGRQSVLHEYDNSIYAGLIGNHKGSAVEFAEHNGEETRAFTYDDGVAAHILDNHRGELKDDEWHRKQDAPLEVRAQETPASRSSRSDDDSASEDSGSSYDGGSSDYEPSYSSSSSSSSSSGSSGIISQALAGIVGFAMLGAMGAGVIWGINYIFPPTKYTIFPEAPPQETYQPEERVGIENPLKNIHIQNDDVTEHYEEPQPVEQQWVTQGFSDGVEYRDGARVVITTRRRTVRHSRNLESRVENSWNNNGCNCEVITEGDNEVEHIYEGEEVPVEEIYEE